MRSIWLILVVLASGCPGIGGGGTPPSSFAVDSCSPEAARVDAVTPLDSAGAALSVGSTFPTQSGGQGLPMIDITVRVDGDVGSCVMVTAGANAHHESGGLKVDPATHAVHVFMGPVDDSFTFDVEVGGARAEADVTYRRVSALR